MARARRIDRAHRCGRQQLHLVITRLPTGVHVADTLVSDHIRALMAPQPTDVISSDRHTVKPWFNGRIPESPRVVDLAKEDFPLVGGRLDVVGQIPVRRWSIAMRSISSA